MYEINGIQVSREQLEAEAQRRGITFEELLAANKDVIKQLQPEIAMPSVQVDGTLVDSQPPTTYDLLQQSIGVPASESTAVQPQFTFEAEEDFLTPDPSPVSTEEQTKQDLQTYNNQIQSYNDQVNNILNRADIDQAQKSELINQVTVPVFGITPDTTMADPASIAVSQKLEEIRQDAGVEAPIDPGSNEYLIDNNKREIVNETIGNVGLEMFKETGDVQDVGIENEQDLEVAASQAFVRLREQDPIIKQKLETYKKLFAPQVQQYVQELEQKGIYDLTTQAGVDAAQDKVDNFYANLIQTAMANDPAVKSQSDKIAALVEQELGNKQVALGRAQNKFYQFSDIAQGAVRNIPVIGDLAADVGAGMESLIVGGKQLFIDSPDKIGAQMDGMRVRSNKLGLERLEEFKAEGKSDDEEVTVVLPNPLGFGDDIIFRGTIPELEEQFSENVQLGTESLIENVDQIEDAENFRQLAEKAKFSDGASFRDIMVGLGQSIPTMVSATAGTIATGIAPEIMIPLISAFGTTAVGAQFYADEYMASVRQGIENDPEKYPGGATQENLKKAIVDGEFDNVAQDIAASAVMSQLERIGAGKSVNSFYKVLKVNPVQGIRSIYKDGLKQYIGAVKRGAVQVTSNGLSEGLTENFQTVVSQVNQGVKETGLVDPFKYIDGEEIKEATLAGTAIGAVIPFSAQVRNQTTAELRNIAMDFAKKFDFKSTANLARREKFFSDVSARIKQKYSDASGNIIKEKEYQQEMEAISDIRNAGMKVPGTFSEKAKSEAIDLMVEKQTLLREIKSIDEESLTREQKKRVKEIDNRLAALARVDKYMGKSREVAEQLDDDIVDEFLDFESEQEMVDFLVDKGLDEETAKNRANARAVEINLDGKEYVLINNERILNPNQTKGAFFTGSHEILHKFLKNTLRKNPQAAFDLANILSRRLAKIDLETLSPAQRAGLKGFESTLQKYKKDPNISDAKKAEEVITLFSEFAEMGAIPFETKMFQGIRDKARRLFQKLPGAKGLDFKNERDVFNFIKDYNTSLRKGRLTRAQIRSAEEGIDIADDIAQEQETIRETAREARDEGSQAKDIDIEIALEQGKNPVEIAEMFRADMRNLAKNMYGTNVKYPQLQDVLVDELILDTETGRGVSSLVEAYQRKQPEDQTLAQFVMGKQAGMPQRIKEIAARVLQIESEGNITKQEEDLDEDVEKESLRKSLEIEKGGELYNKVINSVKKIFGTRLPSVSSGKFIQELEKQFAAFLETDVKELMGTPASQQYKDFIRTYGQDIYEKLSQRTINKRLQELKRPAIDPETGKQLRILTKEAQKPGARVKDKYSGPPKFEKIELSPDDLVDYFVALDSKLRKGSRPSAKRNTLSQIVAAEFGFDAAQEVLSEFGQDRADKFGEDVLKSEIAFIARELGRGVDYSFAKDIVLPKEFYDEFIDVAPGIVDIVLKSGYNSQEYKEALNGVSEEVAEGLNYLFEEDETLGGARPFIKTIFPFIENIDQETADKVKAKDFVVRKVKKGVKEINKEAADNLSNFARSFRKILDTKFINAFNDRLDFLGFTSRILDPAARKADGTTGAYNTEYLINKNIRYSEDLSQYGITPSHIIPMNKDVSKLQKILNPIFKNPSLEAKLKMLEDERTKIENANIANINGLKYLAKKLNESYEKGEVSLSQLFQFFQMQTNIVRGLRALSAFDYIYLEEGNQLIESKKKPNKGEFFEQTPEQRNNIIQEFKDEFVNFEERYELRLQQKLDKGLTFEEAQYDAAFGTVSAYKDLVIKGEHLGPNANTMAALMEAVVEGKIDDATLDNILAEHTQFFGPTYIMDLIDAKGLEGGAKIALTSKEGLLRLTKFLNSRPDISNNIYAIDGQKGYQKLLQQEVFEKQLGVLNESISQAKELDIDMLNATGVIQFDEAPTMDQVLQKAKIIDEALAVARDPNAPIKKIRVFDFDDTLATSNNIVKANGPDGDVIELNAEEFAERGADLKNRGYVMDFTDFDRVTDGGRGPLFKVAEAIRDARGNEDLFVLTARAPEAQGAIYDFLKSQGLEFKRQNIIGLGNSTGEAKANWIISKAAEGYNDFYFADDAIQNVEAVRKALDVIDVKSKVQQAKFSFAKDLDADFNKIIQEKTGIAAEKEFSSAKAQVRGANKGNYKFFIPYSAEDFQGLIYPLLSKGSLGDAQMAWFKTYLFDPYARAMENLSQDRLNLMNDFKALKKDLNVPKDLQKETDSGFSNEQAVRVYLWDKQGIEVPGLSKRDQKQLVKQVQNDPTLLEFAEQIATINKDPYTAPDASWLAGSITTDLLRGLKEVKRPKYLQEWQQNVDLIFSEKNLNKLEAAYGPKYVEAMRNILSRMKSGTNRLNQGSRLSNKILNYINGSNAAIMFFNTRSAILQTISSINFLNWGFNNPLKAGQAFANQPQYWKDFMTLMNSDFLRDRRNGLRINITESEIADAAKTSKNKAKAALAYILSKGYLPTQYADSFAIAVGGATYYRNRIKDLMKKEGMSEKEASEQAMREFREIAEENQQSSRPDKISQQQASDAGRLILMFANTPMQYARLQKRAFQDLVNGRGDSKANVSKLIYYGVVQNIIFNALQQAVFAIGFGDEEEEKDEKRVTRTLNGMLDSLLRGLGIAGATTSVIKNFLTDVYERSGRSRPEYVDAVYKLLQISPPVSSKISRIRQAAYLFDSKKRRKEIMDMGFSIKSPAFMAFAKVVSATANIPLDRVLQKFDNLEGATVEEAELWQRIALIAGWPRWDIMPDGKQYKKKKKQQPKVDFDKLPTPKFD